MSDWDDAAVSERIRGLVPWRVREILLLSSPYDSFILEADGRLSDRLYGEYMALNLSSPPRLNRARNGMQALAMMRGKSFDLVVIMSRVPDMPAERFAQRAKGVAPRVPVILMTYHDTAPAHLINGASTPLDGFFVWSGDDRLLLALVKTVEDRTNVEHDTRSGMVRVILLVEDSPTQYSTLLPVVYSETVRQTHLLMADGLNNLDRLYRLRARPKVLLARTYEEAVSLVDRFGDYLLGVISDVRLPRGDAEEPDAGLMLVRYMRQRNPDLPVLLHSADAHKEVRAHSVGADFSSKAAPHHLEEVRRFIRRRFGFGDFIFRLPTGQEVDRAETIAVMREALERVPGASLRFHAERNHISNWLMARSEFPLALELQPRRVAEFANIEAMRRYIVEAFERFLDDRQRGRIVEFSRGANHLRRDFQRLGDGSLGGKGRGIAFMYASISSSDIHGRYPDVDIEVPRTIVVCTGEFDRFLDDNNLRTRAIHANSDAAVARMFREATLSPKLRDDLAALLDDLRHPLALRSSSLLEDSHSRPFAGVYRTYMLPNNDPSLDVRIDQAVQAVKMVYASTFTSTAKAYMRAIRRRVEEEKMAVVIQRLVGTDYGSRYYPTISGIAQSHNFYPIRYLEPEDGVAVAALGLGRTVVSGRRALRFCPRHPDVLPQMSSTQDALSSSQRHFYALDMTRPRVEITDDDAGTLVHVGLDAADADGSLVNVGATYSPENDRIYDTVFREGIRLVNFAPMLKHGRIPLADILVELLDSGQEAMGCPVQIEFACDVGREPTAPSTFALLQIRPLVTTELEPGTSIDDVDPECLIVRSQRALGNGVVEDVRDVVYIPPRLFDARHTRQMAREVARVNGVLSAAGRPYMLIGAGRWGTADPLMGVPLDWGQVSFARVIVELGLEGFDIDPSQGTHFFHNITSLQIAYLTVDPRRGGELVRWEWLAEQEVIAEHRFVRHVRTSEPLEARVEGRSGRAVVIRCVREAPLWADGT